MLCAGGTGENTCNGDSGGPLILRNAGTGEAVVVGVTSHGPDCLAGPNYAYGYYTDVRMYLPAITNWTLGLDITWPLEEEAEQGSGEAFSGELFGSDSEETDSSSSSKGSSEGSSTNEVSSTSEGSVFSSEPSAAPGPSSWQPVPGWQGQGWPAGGASWQEVFCQLFPTSCTSLLD